jgi:hypothetical protein
MAYQSVEERDPSQARDDAMRARQFVAAAEDGDGDAEMDERIARFAELVPDWDSYGAKAISPRAIAVARDVLRTVVAQTAPALGGRELAVCIAPLPNGGVVLEWHGANADLEVEVTATGASDLLVERQTRFWRRGDHGGRRDAPRVHRRA